jgi:N-methylhydantoinase A
MGLDLHQAAAGILDIVNENMLGALRLVTVQQGLDPRDFALVAFGGAGPLHGNAMAMLAACYPVIVPPTPGVLSALGFLYADVRSEFARTLVRNVDDVLGDEIADILRQLGRDAEAWLVEEGVDATAQAVRYEADVRYFRQGYEFALGIDPTNLVNGGLADLEARFGTAHERLYGFKLDQPVELVNLRAVATGQIEKMRLPKFESEGPDAEEAVIGAHQVHFDNHFTQTNLYDRAKMKAGNLVPGPAIVTQTDSTTVIHPGHGARVDEHLNLLIFADGSRH